MGWWAVSGLMPKGELWWLEHNRVVDPCGLYQGMHSLPLLLLSLSPDIPIFAGVGKVILPGKRLQVQGQGGGSPTKPQPECCWLALSGFGGCGLPT